MSKTTSSAYALLLLVAFAVGLVGTIAMSRALSSMRPGAPRPASIERPASAPTVERARALMPVEC